jgi:hypothetical protein
MFADVVGNELQEQQRAVVSPVQVLEDKQKGSLPSRPVEDSADCISNVETNRLVVRDGRTLEGESLTHLGHDKADVPRTPRKESPNVVC